MAQYKIEILIVVAATFLVQEAMQAAPRGLMTTTRTPSTTPPTVYATADDMLASWGVCPECDYCIVRNNSAKCFFVIHSVTWAEAKIYCANWSGELATIRSDVETRFLNRTRSLLGMETNAWIGLRWKPNAKFWLWTDDVPLKTYTEYSMFAPGEPGEGWGSCVEFIGKNMYDKYPGFYTGYWMVQDCLSRRDAICQYKKKMV